MKPTHETTIPTLETERLRLRPFQLSDLDAYADFCADAEVMEFIGPGAVFSRAETWNHIARMLGHWQLLKHGMWAVEELATGLFVGRVGSLQPEGWPGFELGWLLGKPFWGRGFATEAAEAALGYAFKELNQSHVISLMYPKNSASIRVAQRLGETIEAEITLFHMQVLQFGIHRNSK